jgi:antitoxin component YwqK of YwqJK toxin-antitoxin module
MTALSCVYVLFSSGAASGQECPPGTKPDRLRVMGIVLDEIKTDAAVCVRGDGKLHGPARALYKNGRVWAKGSYRDGVKEGTWTTYFENGQLMSEGSYENGRRNGPWKFWLNSGKLSESGSYANGLKTGTWLFYLDGKVSNRIDYSTKVDKRIECPDGTTFLGEIVSEDGEEVQWCEKSPGTKHGPYREFGERGLYDEPLVSGQYKNGKPFGKWQWNKSLGGHLSRKGSYDINGKKTGVWERWTYHLSTDSTLESGHAIVERSSFKDGKLHGKFTTWHKNGKVAKECEYIAGKLNGKLKEWHQNGKLANESEYINGKLHGVSRDYDEMGKLVNEQKYEHGEETW